MKLNIQDLHHWPENQNIGPVMETSPDPFLLGGGFGTGTSCVYDETADENKNVFCFQVLVGHQDIILKRLTFDFFGGIGVRMKLREKLISYYDDACLGSSIYYSPPKKEIIKDYLLSLHAGVRIGFPFKIKTK